MKTRFQFSLLTLLLAAVTLAACSSSPTGRKQLVLRSDAELEQEGTRQFRLVQEQMPLVQDGAMIDYVACVADAVIEAVSEVDDNAADMYWEMAIIESQEVNAQVMPGGKMIVHKGIVNMADNQHQLASVLGHEVAHVTARHANERASRGTLTGVGIDVASILLGGGYSNQTRGARQALSAGAALGIMNPFSRKQETEADIVGLEYMARAGFDPRESVELWQKMNATNKANIPEYMSTHPSGETRIESLVAHFPTALALYNEAQAAGRNPNCER